jgi:hypothetical protein
MHACVYEAFKIRQLSWHLFIIFHYMVLWSALLSHKGGTCSLLGKQAHLFVLSCNPLKEIKIQAGCKVVILQETRT